VVAIGFAGLLGPQVLREQRVIKVILASPGRQAQQVRSAQQARPAPKDPPARRGLLAPPARRGLLEIPLNNKSEAASVGGLVECSVLEISHRAPA
jgi:hypothetical protein